MARVLLLATTLLLTGCGVLGALAQEDVLRVLVIFVVVAAVAGFLVARMRR